MRRTPPGPRGHWLLGNLPEYGRDLLGFLTSAASEHGDIVRLRLGPTHALLLNHPDQIEQVLATRQHEFAKYRFFWRHVMRLFGNGLLTSSGELWKRQHQLMAPAFRQQRLALSADAMVDATRRLLGRWRDGEERDVRHDMARLTLDNAARVLFDRELDRVALDRVSHAVDLGSQEVGARFKRGIAIPDWVPTPGNRRYMTAVHELEAVAADIVGPRQASPGTETDLLSTLLRSRDAQGRAMDAKLLRDEVITLLLAGHETTALALTWTLYLLSRHPEVAAKVEAEVDAVVGPGRLPGAGDISGLRYVASVLTESMRLYPPVYILGREAIGDVEIEGHRLRRGTVMLMSQWVVHRDPRFFPEPEAFKPERWGEGLARALPRFAYFPFGGGARICIGQPLALMEAKLVLATICQRFRLADARTDPVAPFPTVTLRPDRPIRLRLLRRAPADRRQA